MRVLAFLVSVAALAASTLEVSAAKNTSCSRSTAKPTLVPVPAVPTPVPSTKTTPTTAPGTPKPTATPNDTEIGNDASSGLNFQAKLDGIYMNGKPFMFKGANYFGMEGELLVPHGLWGGAESTTITKIAKFLKSNNFNAVRIPFAVDAVLQNSPVDAGNVKNEEAFVRAFSGKKVAYLDVMDHVVKTFADNKLLVLFDAQMLYKAGGIGELWYSSDADKDHFENAWKILATRYKDAWNVVGADLKNEPHGKATWGSGDVATDWRLASLKWATSILKINPRWLIFVEGMDRSSRDDPMFPCFWGENLMDVQRAPLELPVPERLVYSPHVYGPDVSKMSYFEAANFPANMPAIWDKHFGYVHQKHGPVVMGEWGGTYRNAGDKKWQDEFAAYLKKKSIGWFYWSLNPNAGDTEGLLEKDWNSPRADKLPMLAAFKGTPIP